MGQNVIVDNRQDAGSNVAADMVAKSTPDGYTLLMTSSLSTALPHVRAGRLRSLGVTSAARTPLAPDFATVAESAGLPGYEAMVWYGMLAPAGTPAAIVHKLNGEIERALKQKETSYRRVQLGFEPCRNTPGQFTERVEADIVKWGKVVRDSGAKAD